MNKIQLQMDFQKAGQMALNALMIEDFSQIEKKMLGC